MILQLQFQQMWTHLITRTFPWSILQTMTFSPSQSTISFSDSSNSSFSHTYKNNSTVDIIELHQTQNLNAIMSLLDNWQTFSNLTQLVHGLNCWMDQHMAWCLFHCMGDNMHKMQLFLSNDSSPKSVNNHKIEVEPVPASYKTKRCIFIVVISV